MPTAGLRLISSPCRVFVLTSLTDVMIYVDQLVQEIFDRSHAAQDDGVKRRHPLLLPVTQLKAQVPDTLQRLATTKTQPPLNTHTHISCTGQICSTSDRTQCE